MGTRKYYLAVLFAGVGMPVFSAAPVAGSGPSAGTEPPEAIMPGKDPKVCVTHDKNHDGWISPEEFKGLNKDEKAFRTADANRDGRLDMQECANAKGVRN